MLNSPTSFLYKFYSGLFRTTLLILAASLANLGAADFASPNSSDEFNRISKYYYNGNTSRSIKEFELLLSELKPTDTKYFRIILELANLYDKTNNINGLTRSIERIHSELERNKLKSKVPHPWLYFGARQAQLSGNNKQAIKLLEFLLNHQIYSQPNDYNYFYLLKSNILIAHIYFMDGDLKNTLKYADRLIILSASIDTLSPALALDALKNYAQLLLDLGKINEGKKIVLKIKTQKVQSLTGNSIDRFDWDLLKANIHIELGEFEKAYTTLLETESRFNPKILISGFKFLKRIYMQGVSGYLIGKESALEKMIKDVEIFEKVINSLSKADSSYINLIKKVHAILSNDHTKYQNDLELNSAGIANMEITLNKMVLAKRARRNGSLKEAVELDILALKETIRYMENVLAYKSTINLDVLWSDKFILEKALSSVLKNRSGNTNDFIFKAFQLLNYSSDNDGVITKNYNNPARKDIDSSEIKSYERLFNNKNRLILQSTYKLIDTVNEGVFFKVGDKLKSEFNLVRQYSKYEDMLNKLSREQGIVRKSLLDKVTFPSLKDVQQSLRNNEALYFPSFIQGKLFSGCLTNSSFDYAAQEVSEKGTINLIKSLLRYFQTPQILSRGNESLFPANDAYTLYNQIFKSVPSCANHKNLIITPHPELLSIPFNALLLEKPVGEFVEKRYKSAPWFITKHSSAIFPSIKSYKTLRSSNSTTSAKKDFVGFGNAQFGVKSANLTNLKENKLFLRGINNKNLFADLPPLPDTEGELRKIKALFPDNKSQIYLKEAATEKAVRTSDLANYKIISFATHALGKGDNDNFNEPALILTPADPNESFDDGILTTSEIARFDLSSNLVILSACNTYTSNGTPDGNSLSGFANSFFLAGTKALAVTQWPVYSNYAKEITTRLLSNSFSNHKSLSENLNITMLDLIKNPLDGTNSDPKFWAPFVIVGNGWQNLQQEIKPPNSHINILWSKNYGHTYDEGNSVFYDKDSNSFYLSGISTSKSPHIKTKRVISYLKQISRDGTILKSKDFIELSGRVIGKTGMDGRVIFLGQYYSESKFTGAKLLFLDKNFNETINYIVDTDLFDLPKGLVSDGKHHYLFVGHHDWRPNVKNRASETLSVYKLDNKLDLIRQINITPFIDKITKLNPNMHIDNYSEPTIYQNQLIIAANFSYFSSTIKLSEAGGLFENQENAIREHYSVLYLFDIGTLKLNKTIVLNHKTTSSFVVSKDDLLFLVGNKTLKQSFNPDIFVSRAGPDFNFDEIFTYKSSLGQFSKNIYIYNDYIVVVGKNQSTFKVLAHESLFNPDGSMKNDYFDDIVESAKSSDDFWVNKEKLNQGWIILLDQNGKFVEDKIIKDNSYSSLNSLDIDESGNGVATGLANGEQILELGFSLN